MAGAWPCTYTAPGGSKTVTVGSTGYNVQPNFVCSGIAEYGPSFIPLLTSITYADGSSYQITYEDTLGFAGSKTGRIASVTLPTGGSISYSYSGGSNGRGIFCDGTTAGFTRTVNDGTSSFQDIYSIVQNGDGTSVTHVIHNNPSPQPADETVINFNGGFETLRTIYQGPSVGGTVLRTIQTCYNNVTNCNAPYTISTPITAPDVYTNLGAVTSRVYTTYNTYGLPTEIDGYDFAGNPLKKTLISYATNLGNIVDRPASVTVKDGSNNILADTEYRYDEYGLVSNTPPVPQHGDPPQ